MDWQHSLQRLSPSPRAWTSLLSACTRSQSWRAAIAFLEASPGPSVYFYNAAIAACRSSWPQSLDLLEDLRLFRLQPDHFSLSAACAACTATGRWAFGLDLQRHFSLPWSVVTAGASLGHWAEGLKLLTALRAAAVQLSAVFCNAAVSACEKGGRWQAALRLATGTKADAATWGAVLLAMERGSLWQEALHCLLDLKRLNIRVNDMHFAAAITAVRTSAHGWHLSSCLLERARCASIRVNDFLLSACISAFECHRQWESAQLLVGDACDVVRNAMVAAMASSVQWAAALQAQRLSAPGVNARLEALSRALLWRRAVEALRPAGAAGSAGWGSCMAGCARSAAWQAAAKLWQKGLCRRLRPAMASLNAVVAAGRWQDAMCRLSGMQRFGLEADVAVCGAVMNTCRRAGAAHAAMNLLEHMQSMEMHPDETAWAAVATGAQRNQAGHVRFCFVRILLFQILSAARKQAIDVVLS
ncbi:unnamed protein product [Effrenium voratum]|nr:unnamed protein product [Effrenium voratum]